MAGMDQRYYKVGVNHGATEITEFGTANPAPFGLRRLGSRTTEVTRYAKVG
jgi:hypothetical protein